MMNRNLLIAILFIFGAFTVAEVNGQAIDHAFTYQGELMDAGKPANDDYDITIQGFDSQAGGVSTGSLSTHIAVTVDNGLFTLDNVDLGAATFDGKDLWLEVSVRKTSVAGSYTALSPRQSLKAVPYAKTLINGNASTGQVLTFDGSQWAPATSSESPWTVDGGYLSYSAGAVSIGSESLNGTPLFVQTNAQNAASFYGGSRMYVYFLENSTPRGYVGSYLDPAIYGVNDEDFEIGTQGGSTGNMHIVTGNNEPRITVTADGKVGINRTVPYADLHIEGTTDGDLIRVRVDGSDKFVVDDNGGTTIGSSQLAPVDGLLVTGDSKLKGGVVIGDTISAVPPDGLLVKGGVSIGYQLVLPPPGGLLVKGETTINDTVYVNDFMYVNDSMFVSSAGSQYAADIVLRGNGSATNQDEGVITSDPRYTGSDMWLLSNDAVVVQLDRDNDENGQFEIRNGLNDVVFDVLEDGTVRQNGSTLHASDKRLKKDISDIPYGLAEILVLEPKAYHWKNRDQQHKSFGLIAQDVQPVIKEIVHARNDKEETLSLSYTELIPVLIKAIQEQHELIEQQDKKINDLVLVTEQLKLINNPAR